MNYHQYYPVDVVNGEGTRCTLFVAGCEHQCRGCHNKSTWRPDSGVPFTREMEDQIIADLRDTIIPRAGLSLSGGDPLHPQNCAAIRQLVDRVRTECPGKNIWLWTGYRLDEMTDEQRMIATSCNVVIDGKFILAERDLSLEWRGSRNQVIHRFS